MKKDKILKKKRKRIIKKEEKIEKKDVIENEENNYIEDEEEISEDEDEVYLSDDFQYNESNIKEDEKLSDFEFNSTDDDDEEDDDEKSVKIKNVYKDEEDENKEDKVQKFDGLFKDVNDDDDSSEDERMRNSIGNVPLEWYKEYDHIGYTPDGQKIMRKKRNKDSIDDLIEREDDPNFLRKIYDEKNDEEYVLTNEDLSVIINVQKGKFPPGYNQYKDHVEWMEYDSRFPVIDPVVRKSRFVPNKSENKQVIELYRKMLRGFGYPRPRTIPKEQYLLWGTDNKLIDNVKRIGHLKPPKLILPGHDLSYRPPDEYIYERKGNVQYDSLRNVPSYANTIKERYERCLDLYLAPRVQKKRKIVIDPKALLPELPNPQELRPFPEIQSMVYEGHDHIIRSISVSPNGNWLITGCDDKTVRLWEIDTGRTTKIWKFKGEVRSVEWNPNPNLNLFSVAVNELVYVINAEECATQEINDLTLKLFPDDEIEKGLERDIIGKTKKKKEKTLLNWTYYTSKSNKSKRDQGILLCLSHLKFVTQITWHSKGDYFCSLSPDAYNDGVVIHQLSQAKSQKPFKNSIKFKGVKIQKVLFHPVKPLFFVVTQTRIKIYNLHRQTQSKKMKGRCRYISTAAIHPSGKHMITGGYDKRFEWFENELSSKPFKTLKYHTKAVRSVAFHNKYPLFATCSDDGLIEVFHCTIYDDFVKDPLLVPVKILKGHKLSSDLGVLDIAFHPTQPWLLSSGSDQTIRLWTS